MSKFNELYESILEAKKKRLHPWEVIEKYPWTLMVKYPGAKEYVPEESFETESEAKSARDKYKKEEPKDMFKIVRTREEHLG